MKDVFIHESCYIDKECVIGTGTKIWHFSHVMSGASIGKQCNIGQNVLIASGVVLGDHVKVQNNVSLYFGVVCENNVFLGPSCVFTNVINPRSFIDRKNEYKKTIIKEGATIGANATIICGNVIGKYALIGAGSVVTKNIPDYTLAVGNPACPIGYVCQCGYQIYFNSNGEGVCNQCGKSYKKTKEGVIKTN